MRGTTKPTDAVKRIAILIATEHGFGREVIRGIMAFATTQPSWVLRRGNATLQSMPWLREWKPDAMISHIDSADAFKAIRGLHVPLLDLATRFTGDAIPPVWQDDRAAGRITARYFHAKGFRDLAFVGYKGHGYSTERQAGFEAQANELEVRCHLFLRDASSGRSNSGKNWAARQRLLTDWLSALPKPIGIMACHDGVGAELIDACRSAGIAVPEDVAIVGVEDDDLICFTTQPHLSSVRMPNEAIGYHAALHIDSLLTGRPTEQVILQPVGVITRESSDLVATEDLIVSQAVKFIQANLSEPIQVETVLEELGVSQSQLERRFRAVLGRSPLAEIRRQRIEHAKLLLAETRLPMTRIAQLCGFNSAVRFSMVFRELAGQTPSAYREALSPKPLSP